MRTASLTLLVAAALALAAGCKKPEGPPPPPEPTDAPAAPDRDRFQGVWKIDESATGEPGKGLNREDKLRFQVQGDRVLFGDPKRSPESYTAAWDGAALPRTLTLTPLGSDGKPDPGAKQVWIYKFEGEALVVALSGPGAPAPKAFTARPSSGGGTAGAIVLRMSKTNEPPAPPGN